MPSITGHITLHAMSMHEPSPLAAGQLSIVVARHMAATWPGAAVVGYARERAELVHQLDDADGIQVISYGQTDAERPHEAVEIIVAVLPAAVEMLGALLIGWLGATRWSRGRKEYAPASIAGIKVTRPDGTRIQIDIRDGMTRAERRALLQRVLGGAAEGGRGRTGGRS